MKAIVCPEFGPPDVLYVEERETPTPGDGELLIEPDAWGVNYVDALMVAGGYQLKPELPFVPGLEAAGRVVENRSDNPAFAPGTAVIIGMRPGTFAEQVVVPKKAVMPVPAGMSMDQAAVMRSAFQTAYHGLVQGGRLESGEVALIHGAGGGMGLAAVQVAKLLGATVVATASRLDRLQAALDFGADHIVSYGDNEGRFREQVRDLVGGADVVFDPVGGDVFDESMRCLNYGARLVIVGFTSGRAATARTNHMLIKGASVVGIRAGEFARRHPAEGKRNQEVIWAWASEGKIQSYISHRFVLEEAADAMRTILDRQVIGRVILER